MIAPVANRRYSKAEIARLRELNPGFTMPGHVMRYDADGMVSFVPWRQAGGGHGWAGDPGAPARGFVATWDEDPWPKDPIRKRTPQQRVDSLMLKFIDDCKRTGTVPGLSDERIRAIVGEDWKDGQARGITAEDVRAVATHFLSEAANRHEASEYKKVTRTAPSD